MSLWIRHPQERQILVQACKSIAASISGTSSKALASEANADRFPRNEVIKRLDSEVVAGHEYDWLRRAQITDREREHSVQPGNAIGALILRKDGQ